MVAVSVASFNPRDPPFKVRELADEFLRYGTLVSVQVWQPGFAVVEYEELSSALDAALQHDGRHGWIVSPFLLPHTSAESVDHFERLVQRQRERERERGRGRAHPVQVGRGPGYPDGCNLCGKPGHSSSVCRLLRRPGTHTNRMHPTPPSRRHRSPNPPRSSSKRPAPPTPRTPRYRGISNPPSRSMSPNPRIRMSSIPPTPGNFLFAETGEASHRSSPNPPIISRWPTQTGEASHRSSPNPPILSRWPTPPTPGNFLLQEPGEESPRSSSNPPNRSMSPDPPNRSMSPTPPTRKRRRSSIIGFDHATRPRSRRRRCSRIPSPPRDRHRSPGPPGYGHRSYDTTAGSSAQNLKDHSPPYPY